MMQRTRSDCGERVAKRVSNIIGRAGRLLAAVGFLAVPAEGSAMMLRQGLDGYAGCDTIYITAFDEPAEVFRGQAEMRVRTGNARQGVRKGLVRFAGIEQAVPRDRRVVSAALRLYALGGRNAWTNDQINVFPVLASWEAAAADWSHRTAADAWAGPGMEAGVDYDQERELDSFVPPAAVSAYPHWVEISLPAGLVQGWAERPDLNHGLVITPFASGDPSGTGIDNRFAGRAHAHPSLRPHLVLETAPRDNIALDIGGAAAHLRLPDGRETPAPEVINGMVSDESAVALAPLPAEIIVDLPSLVQVDAVRLFPGVTGYAGNPSGECGLLEYELHGFVNGAWTRLTDRVTRAPRLLETEVSEEGFYYLHAFTPTTIEKVRLTVFRSSDTGRRASSPDLPIVAEADRVAYLREIEVFSVAPREQPLRHIRRLVEGDFRLPVWLNRDTAELWLYATEELTEPLALELSFSSRLDGTPPRPPLAAGLAPGDQPLRLPIEIAGWPEEEYFVDIRAAGGPGAPAGELRRLLRRQTLEAPPPPPEPVAAAGQTWLMVDDWHLAEQRGALHHRLHPAEQFAVTEGPIEGDRIHQRGLGLRIRDDGLFEVTFWDDDRAQNDRRRHRAVSADLLEWTITPEEPAPAPPPAAKAASIPPTPSEPVVYRWYDPDRDGPVDLSQVQVRWVGLRDTTLGEIPAPGRSAWPLWVKSPHEILVLQREPLIVDKVEYRDGEFDTWRDTNDNFGGQWLSEDGGRLQYVRSRTALRFPPFRVDYDNLWQVNRLLGIWNTTDGVTWSAAWWQPPDGEDGFAFQHYGVNTFPAGGDGLRLAYVFAYDQLTQQIWLELNASRDGLLWQRFREPFADNGPIGSWNGGMIFVDTRPIPHGDYAYQLLNNVTTRPHFYGLPTDPERVTAESLRRRYGARGLPQQWPYFEAVGGWEGLAEAVRKACQTVGVMRFRRDGWVSLRAEGEGAAVTRILRAGTGLALNARTDEGGEILVEALDEDGSPLPGYSGPDAFRFSGDAVSRDVDWEGKTLPDQPFRLRLTLRDADLFALYW